MLRITSLTRFLVSAVLTLVAVLAALAFPAASLGQNPPGRFLVSPRNDIIFLCNIDGSNCFHVTGAVQAANDPGGGDQDVSFAYNPSVANNGTIVFQAAYTADGTCAGSSSQGICAPHIFAMNADGTNVRQVTFNPPYNPPNFFYGGDNAASISPDGTMVAFVSSRNNAVDSQGTQWSSVQVYVVNIDGSGLRQVTPFVYDAAGSPHGNMFTVAWSPDSKKLAFKGTSYGTVCGTYNNSPIEFLGLGTVNLDGTGLTYIGCDNVNAAGGAFSIDWSANGLIADARDSVGYGPPAIRITDLTGQGRYSSGLNLAQLGTQASGNGQICPTDSHCIRFSPDSTALAYENNSPSDNPSFYGISTINLDGTGRNDAVVFGTAYDGSGLHHGMWWAPGPAVPAAAQITLAPTTVEVWPGFSQQLTPSLLDAGSNLILHSARAYGITYAYFHNCGIEIGPYGLAMFSSLQGGNEGSTISAGNEGVTSVSALLKCWASSPCNYALSSTNESFPASGGPGSVDVTADPGNSGSTCPWGPKVSDPWITISSGLSGSGNGTVHFNLAANNTGGARQGTLTIGGSMTLTVNQSAPGAVLQSILVSPSSASVVAGSAQQFLATGHYSDNTTQDLTTSVTWSSADTSIATISNASGTQGLATGLAAGGPITITAMENSISGTAQLTVTAPAVSLSPTSLGFGKQELTTTSSSQGVTLTNTGTANLTISSISVSAGFGQTNNCPVSPSTLSPNSSCTVSVTFSPTVAGVNAGVVTITDNASGSPHTVSLSGTGTDFSAGVSPTSQTIKVGKSATYTLTLTPISGFSGTIALTCSGAPPKGSCTVTPSSLALNGVNNSAAKATVKTMGGKNGTPKGTYTVTLTGAFSALTHRQSATLVVQ